jgi:bacterioferritin
VDKEKVVETLNNILEHELAGVVRYTHYSLMIFGHNRIPIVKWLRDQATESLDHASQTGEYVTTLGGHPSLKISKLLETHKHSVDDILKESLVHEREQIENFVNLLGQVEGTVYLEEWTRQMILNEEQHVSEIEKMIRKPGSIEK